MGRRGLRTIALLSPARIPITSICSFPPSTAEVKAYDSRLSSLCSVYLPHWHTAAKQDLQIPQQKPEMIQLEGHRTQLTSYIPLVSWVPPFWYDQCVKYAKNK
jgi:hypothetical protein